jgi:hypothetical protein
MSALGALVHGLAVRAAVALGLGRSADRDEAASADTSAPRAARSAPLSEVDLRDRERELRVLMSNWM